MTNHAKSLKLNYAFFKVELCESTTVEQPSFRIRVITISVSHLTIQL